jgi:hypothetical protein
MTGRPSALRPGWIVGPRADLLLFGGPLVVAALVAWFAWRAGALHTQLPLWGFALLIVGVDVAHVWSTAFRVYLDPEELRRRPGLYAGVPLACFGVGVAAHLVAGPAGFWRLLAYLAVFHFVRQQWGWVAYSRHRAGEPREVDRRFDQVAIYNVTLFPLLWWHTHLPRNFDWFVSGDFVSLPGGLAGVGQVVHWSINLLYLGHQVRRYRRGQGVNLAKLWLWFTTWAIWYGGIVLLDSDLVFTSANVLAHGVPYLAVVWGIQRDRWAGTSGAVARLFRPRAWWAYLLVLALVGYGEEWLWDRLVWHEHGALFHGPALTTGATLLSILVPLLATPQATHYVLDAWIWKTAGNREVSKWLER